MAANLSALSPITTSLTALGNLVVVSPQATIGYQPQPSASANGTVQPQTALVFNYEGEQNVSVESDITDHFVEDNTAIQDQWAIKPVVITTHGYIGELNDVAPGILAAAQTLAERLTVIGAYSPLLTETALIAYNEAFFLYQTAKNTINNAVSAVASLTGTASGESVIGDQPFQQLPNQTKQQEMFQQLYGYLIQRTLFTVQTPWAVFQNMALMSLRPIQDAETRVMTDFELKFKQIRTASTITQLGVPAVLQSRLINQADPLTNLGSASPAPSISAVQGLTDMSRIG